MDVIDRYLHAVRRCLPREQQDDILAEISEDLRSQIDERESELGRKLDDGELAAMVKRRGHPMAVAARYLPRQYLIGPAFYPTYRFVLKVALLWVLVPVFLGVVGPIVALTSAHPGKALVGALFEIPRAAITAFAIITLVFAALDRYQSPSKVLDNWNPLCLPPVLSQKASASRRTAWTDLFMGLIGAASWCWAAWYLPNLGFGGIYVTPAPVWRSLFWVILFVASSGILLAIVGFTRPSTRLRWALRLVIDTASLVLAVLLLRAGNWVDVHAPSLSAASLAQACKWANINVQITIMIAVIVILFDIVKDARGLRRSRAGGRSPLNGVAAGVRR